MIAPVSPGRIGKWRHVSVEGMVYCVVFIPIDLLPEGNHRQLAGTSPAQEQYLSISIGYRGYPAKKILKDMKPYMDILV